jgi:diguanylate cyclase (GGDEF)-like protein
MAGDKGPGAAGLDNADQRRLKVLTYIARRGSQARLEPVVSNTARIGYNYPEVCAILECKPGDELEVLEFLADTGCLSREVFDKVDLCPFCLHGSLRLRRLCPYCRSSLIMKKEILHHFRCGWVGIEEEASHGTDLVCPKCRKLLRHIGVDYERAAQSYYCTTCHKIFTEPLEELLSLPCGRHIPKDGTMIQPVFTYAVTPIGARAANKQSLDGIPAQRGIVEREFNLYTREYMDTRLAELVNRYLRYRAGFSAALISVDQFSQWIADKGHVAASDLVRLLASVLKGETRDVDLPGLYDDHTFILLLPQTSDIGAAAFARRYLDRTANIEDPNLEEAPIVSIAVAGCPEDGEDAKSITSVLTERLERCISKGGNAIEGRARESD